MLIVPMIFLAVALLLGLMAVGSGLEAIAKAMRYNTSDFITEHRERLSQLVDRLEAINKEN